MNTHCRAILLFCAVSVTSTGWCDIYRFEDGNDTISFTDTPGDSQYTLIIRERPAALSKRTDERSAITRARSSLSYRKADAQELHPSVDLPLKGVITSTTGLRNDPFDGKLRHHNGMDIAAPSGTPVKPVARGTVIFSGWHSGYGNTVIIEHLDGMYTIYAHNSVNQTIQGETVDRSSVIALSGSTGRSTGPHLHFEAWRNGENITQSFQPEGTTREKPVSIASAPVKRFLQPDGTILFTNLR